MQFSFGYNLIGIKYNGYRVSSFFGDQLVMGSYIVRLIPLLLFLIFVNKNFSKKNIIIYFLFFGFSYFSIYISAERTAIGISLMIMFFVFLFIKNIRKYIILFFSLLIILSIIITSFNTNLYDRIIKNTLYEQFVTTTYDEETKTFDKNIWFFSDIHQSHYAVAANMFLYNPLFGIGPKMFRYSCDDIRFFEINGCQTHPHHTYMQLLSESGIIGTIPIIILFLLISIKLLNGFIAINFNKNELDY